MKNNKYGLLYLIVVFLLQACTGSGNSAPEKVIRKIDNYSKKFMPIETLEQAGFEHIDSPIPLS